MPVPRSSARLLTAGTAAVLLAAAAVLATTCLLSLHASAAAIVVDSEADSDPPLSGDGQCTLREAIINANNDAQTHVDCAAGAGNDSITFGAGVTTINVANGLVAGLPPITDADGLTIDGNGAVTVNGQDAVRLFGIASGGVATLTGLAITHGMTTISGGAIANAGTLTLIDTQVTDSAAALFGGGIASDGPLTLIDTTISGSQAASDGGGIWSSGNLHLTGSTVEGNAAQHGGGIYTSGSATLQGTTVSANQAQFGAGILNDDPGALEVTSDSHVDGNTSTGNGGGIVNFKTLTVTNSSVDSNHASGFGGGINNSATASITDSTANGNSAGNSGGGIEFARGTLTVTNSEIGNNTADVNGGAIDSSDGGGTITITASTLEGNSVSGNGGAIYSVANPTTLTITRSTVNDNTATVGGGGLRSDFGIVTLANSTLSHNSAQFGGGFYSGDSSASTLTNVTVTANLASMLGGGVYIPGDVSSTVNLRNTIIADQNTNTDCDGLGFVSMGNNLDSSDTCNLNQASDKPQVDVFLGPLADNGGPTKTHALMSNSSAIDGGDDATCAAAPISGKDQRGISRPKGAHCDIGAYEFVPPTPTPSPTGPPTPTPSPTASPVRQTEVWGDNDCNGDIDTADAVRGLTAVALPDAVEPVDGCPAMGEALSFVDLNPAAGPQGGGTIIWGDVHCGSGLDGADPLDLLRHLSGLARIPLDGFCPQPGDEVVFDR